MSQKRIDEMYREMTPDERKAFIKELQNDIGEPEPDIEDWQRKIIEQAQDGAMKKVTDSLAPYILPLVKDSARAKFLEGLDDKQRAKMEEVISKLPDDALHTGANLDEVREAFRDAAKYRASQESTPDPDPGTTPDGKPDANKDPKIDEAKAWAKEKLGMELSDEAAERALKYTGANV